MNNHFTPREKYLSTSVIEYSFGPDFDIYKGAHLLIKSEKFRTTCTDILKNVPFESYYWYCCRINKDSDHEPFKFIVKKCSFPQDEDSKTFSTYLKKTINVFPNLSKDSLLLVPKRMKSAPKNAYVSIASFMRLGPKDQIADFWKSFGNQIIWFGDFCDQYDIGSVWVSTHGNGVNYLHIRFDSGPKYLDWVPGLTKSGSSSSSFTPLDI